VVDSSIFQPGTDPHEFTAVNLVLLNQHSYQVEFRTYDSHLQKDFKTPSESLHTAANVGGGCHLVHGLISFTIAVRLHGVCKRAENPVVQFTISDLTSEKGRIDLLEEHFGRVKYCSVRNRWGWGCLIIVRRDNRRFWC
jgi:hypothetical protein